MARDGTDTGAPAGHFRRIWSGRDDLRRLLVRDMIVNGTILNVAAMAAGIALLAGGAPVAMAMAVHFAPLPYNLFLALGVWRTAERAGGPLGSIARIAAIVWAAVMVVL